MCVREIGGAKVSSPCRALNMRSAAGSAEHRAASSLRHKEKHKGTCTFSQTYIPVYQETTFTCLRDLHEEGEDMRLQFPRIKIAFVHRLRRERRTSTNYSRGIAT